MLKSVPQRLNLENLSFIFDRIKHLEAFIFFGTLLGFTRENNVIEYDDDIDIYVNAKQFRQLLIILENSDFKIRKRPEYRWYQLNKTPLIIQANRILEGVETYVDFYLYDDSDPKFIMERWNFKGNWKDETTLLKTPKELIFPIHTATMQGIEILVPSRPTELCQFLYGDSWQIPMKKETEYMSRIKNNRPIVIGKT